MEALQALLAQGIPGGDDRRRVLLHAAAAATVVVTLMVLQEEEEEGQQQQHQQQEVEEPEHRVKRRRTARRQFDFIGAYRDIMRDHLRPNAPLFGQEFIRYFRLSRARVEEAGKNEAPRTPNGKRTVPIGCRRQGRLDDGENSGPPVILPTAGDQVHRSLEGLHQVHRSLEGLHQTTAWTLSAADGHR